MVLCSVHLLSSLGWAIAHPSIIAIFNNVKAPYNISRLTSEIALKAILNYKEMYISCDKIQNQRHFLRERLRGMPCVEEVGRGCFSFKKAFFVLLFLSLMLIAVQKSRHMQYVLVQLSICPSMDLSTYLPICSPL